MIRVPTLTEVAAVRARTLLGEALEPQRWVYRMEDRGGRGPYVWRFWNRFAFENRFLEDIPQRGKVNPARAKDFDSEALRRIFPNGMKESQDPKVFYGFLYAEDAMNWFGEVGLPMLASFGYRMLKVPAALVFPSNSGRQVAFFRADGIAEDVGLPLGVRAPTEPWPLEEPERLLTVEEKLALLELE